MPHFYEVIDFDSRGFTAYFNLRAEHDILVQQPVDSFGSNIDSETDGLLALSAIQQIDAT